MSLCLFCDTRCRLQICNIGISWMSMRSQSSHLASSSQRSAEGHYIMKLPVHPQGRAAFRCGSSAEGSNEQHAHALEDFLRALC